MEQAYSEFKANAPVLYAAELYKQNELDIELYDIVVRRLWDELQHQRLLEHTIIREYWNEKLMLGRQSGAPVWSVT